MARLWGDGKVNGLLELWVVYKHPLDYPDKFVARKWILDKPSSETVIGGTINEARIAIPKGLTRFLPDAEDDKSIVETWL
ncbi:unnamed protein product [marine sediment metagenome]|uniref:Uncharacterized protein n=1 Tax=marine sediment metagenome TaxID=412755 RepID=X1C0E7_9ZZZZ